MVKIILSGQFGKQARGQQILLGLGEFGSCGKCLLE